MSKKPNRTLHNCTCENCKQHPYSKIAKGHKAINHVLMGLRRLKRRIIQGYNAVHSWLYSLYAVKSPLGDNHPYDVLYSIQAG